MAQVSREGVGLWLTSAAVSSGEQVVPQRMTSRGLCRREIASLGGLSRRRVPAAPIGQITQGAFADLIFVDYHPYTPLTSGNLPWQIIFGFEQSMVTTTIAAGKVLMKDRELLTLDEAEIAARAREIAPRIWKRYEEEVSKVS